MKKQTKIEALKNMIILLMHKIRSYYIKKVVRNKRPLSNAKEFNLLKREAKINLFTSKYKYCNEFLIPSIKDVSHSKMCKFHDEFRMNKSINKPVRLKIFTLLERVHIKNSGIIDSKTILCNTASLEELQMLCIMYN